MNMEIKDAVEELARRYEYGKSHYMHEIPEYVQSLGLAIDALKKQGLMEASGENDSGKAQAGTASEGIEGLKPCPFCGGDAELKKGQKGGHYAIWCECTRCRVATKSFFPYLYDDTLSNDDVERFMDLTAREWNMRV